MTLAAPQELGDTPLGRRRVTLETKAGLIRTEILPRGRDFGGVFSAPAHNVFLVKFSYWLNM